PLGQRIVPLAAELPPDLAATSGRRSALSSPLQGGGHDTFSESVCAALPSPLTPSRTRRVRATPLPQGARGIRSLSLQLAPSPLGGEGCGEPPKAGRCGMRGKAGHNRSVVSSALQGGRGGGGFSAYKTRPSFDTERTAYTPLDEPRVRRARLGPSVRIASCPYR